MFSAAVRADLTWLAILGVLASTISGVYYLRVMVVMWMKAPEDAPDNARQPFPVGRATAAVVGLCAVALLVLGVLPGGFIEATAHAFGGGADPLVVVP